MATRELAVGDRVFVGGTYGFESTWLEASGERGGYYGRVIEFIPGQNETFGIDPCSRLIDRRWL